VEWVLLVVERVEWVLLVVELVVELVVLRVVELVE
jgi:hypothetical protein